MLLYNNKLDISNFLWKPRLVISYAVAGVKNIGNKRDEQRAYLPMTDYEPGSVYPRTGFIRDSFFSLDGIWDLSHCESELVPRAYDDTVLVPFAPQAKRSGVKKPVGKAFWYRKKFTLDNFTLKHRTLLHFGAVDQVARVYLNGEYLGSHEGGYLPFSLDITKVLKPEGENELCVYVKDELDKKYPYGKQALTPGGMWYTPISGIWQSVWIETLPEKSVDSVRCTFVEDKASAMIEVAGSSPEYSLRLYAPDMTGDISPILKEAGVFELKNGENLIPIEDLRLWSPETPWLYYFDISTPEDSVRSYFALRTISIEHVAGMKRLCLNHRPYYFHGVLDQGYFSDGIYTPVSPEYYDRDVLSMKELGFNMLRKHIKVEPDRFYNACDRYGMIVFQDMVNNGSYSYLRDTIMPTVFPFYVGHFKKDKYMNSDIETRRFFIEHSKDTIERLYNFPCVLAYTVFNEGWGQFDSDMVTGILKKVDPTRIYDSASGWYKQKNSDLDSIHVYFHKVPEQRWKKPALVSEFGGFSCHVRERSSYKKNVYGYGSCPSGEALTDRIVNMYDEEIIPHISAGICGSVYTQLSDVEEEINGLYTYDRKVCKVDVSRMKAVADRIAEAIRRLS